MKRDPHLDTMYFVLLGLVVLHIMAIVRTEIKRGGNIISAVISGRKAFVNLPADRAE